MANTATYTVAQLSQALGVNKQTIRRRIESGALTATLSAGAYRIAPEAVREFLTREGYGADTVDRYLHELETAVTADPATGAQHPAYVMGRIYGILVHLGVESLEHLSVAVVAPGRTFGYLLGKAHRAPGYDSVHDELTALISKLSPEDISARPWDMDRQGRFWLGYYYQQARDMEPDDAASADPDGDDGTVQEDADHDA